MPSIAATRGQVAAAFARVARGAAAQAVSAARKGGASAIGASGLASIAAGAGMVYLPAGFIVGGALAVWFASLLPSGDRQ
jgi:hypothetical protein